MSEDKPEEKIVEGKGEMRIKMGTLMARIASIKVEKRNELGELTEVIEQKYGDD